MKRIQTNMAQYEQAPNWAENNLPKHVALGVVPSVLLIKVHEDGCWIVASRLASDVIANPNSHLGNFMRSHCALLAMSHLSNN